MTDRDLQATREPAVEAYLAAARARTEHRDWISDLASCFGVKIENTEVVAGGRLFRGYTVTAPDGAVIYKNHVDYPSLHWQWEVRGEMGDALYKWKYPERSR